MDPQKKQGTAIIALILGIVSAVAPFTYFLMALGFLSIPGFFLALAAYKRTRTGFSKISLAVNILALGILLFFIIEINYSDYRSSKTIYAYYLPKGFTGWVIIKTKSPDAKPIPVLSDFPGGTYRILIPSSGKLETSDALEDWHRTKYFWYDEKDTLAFEPESGSDGRAYKSLIHCQGSAGQTIQHFYVSGIPRDPQDTLVLNACNSLYEVLDKK